MQYYIEGQDGEILQEPKLLEVQSKEASSTDMMTGSQVVISQYQSIQPEYVLQQVNQSEEVYDERLLHPTEVQSSLPHEPVYTLESHEEPDVNQPRGPPQGNDIETSTVTEEDQEIELINLTPPSMDISNVTNSLSFESQLPGTFSLHNSGAGGKVFQQQIQPCQVYSNVTNNADSSQVPYVVNDASPAKAVTENTVNPQLPYLVNGSSASQTGHIVASQASKPSQPQQSVQNKMVPKPVVLTRILKRPNKGGEVIKLQPEKLTKKLPTKGMIKFLNIQAPLLNLYCLPIFPFMIYS